jgi:Astacin (Peptidase family M12A)
LREERNPEANFLVTSAAADKSIVLLAFRELEAKTCVRFVERTTQADYVEIYNGAGCSSSLGRIGGKQQISMSKNGCITKGTVMHEIIHALGYAHMQNHIDRDNFVRVNFINIILNKRSNFEKVSSSAYGNFGTAYDYLSVMHYRRDAFSRNGKDTIVPLDAKYLNVIGSAELSAGDVARIKNMYKCL